MAHFVMCCILGNPCDSKQKCLVLFLPKEMDLTGTSQNFSNFSELLRTQGREACKVITKVSIPSSCLQYIIYYQRCPKLDFTSGNFMGSCYTYMHSIILSAASGVVTPAIQNSENLYFLTIFSYVQDGAHGGHNSLICVRM